MRRRMFRAACLVVVALLAGCATFGTLEHGEYRDAKVRFKVGNPGEGWERMRLAQGKLAYTAPTLGAALLVNAHCEGVQDSPLEGLTNDLMIGMTERQVVSTERVPWSGREALQTVARAKLDGVPLQLALFVLKKDECVYDIVMSAPPERFDQAKAGFDSVRAGFDVLTRTDRGA